MGQEGTGNHKSSGMLIRDAIFGVNDGVVSMLALVAALNAAQMTSKVIIISAFAEAFSGALSMAVGTYISTKSQMEFLQHELRDESRSVVQRPRLERKHLLEIYRKKGFQGKELESIVDKIMSNPKVWKDVMQREELGFSPTFLQNPLHSGFVMFISFLVASMVPLLPYFFTTVHTFTFPISIFNGLLLLFIVGVGKTHFTGRHPLRSGIEMVIIGSITTALAYSIGTYLPLLFDL